MYTHQVIREMGNYKFTASHIIIALHCESTLQIFLTTHRHMNQII